MRIGVNTLSLFPGQIGGMERCRDFSWERTARETLKVSEEAALNGARPGALPS